VPVDGVAATGSPLLEKLLDSRTTSGARLTLTGQSKEATQYARLVNSSNGTETAFPELHGSITFGTDSLTFTGRACGDILTMRYRRNFVSPGSEGRVDLTYSFAVWDNKDVRSLSHFDAVHGTLERLCTGSEIHLRLEVEGQPLIRGVSNLGDARTKLDETYRFVEYVRHLRTVAVHFGIPIRYRNNVLVQHQDLRALSIAIATLEGKRVYGAHDLREPLSSMLTLTGNADQLRAMLSSVSPVVLKFVESEGMRFRVFNQEVCLPPCELLISGVEPDFGTVDLATLKEGDSVRVTWRPVEGFRCQYLFPITDAGKPSNGL
jgi:hypothetical protein